MIAQTTKDIYFALSQYLVIPNALLLRLLYCRSKGIKLHLGCGDDYITGLINVDGNILRKKELWLDLRNRLPFPTKCANFIYCNHTLEHLFPYDALRLLREMFRIVSEEGVVRLAVPSFERCLAIADGKRSINMAPFFQKLESSGHQLPFLRRAAQVCILLRKPRSIRPQSWFQPCDSNHR